MKELIYVNDKQYNVINFYNRQAHRLTIVFADDSMIDDFLEDIIEAPIRMYTAGYGNDRGVLCGEYVGWTTVWKQDDATITLSDNGEVWEEPEPISPYVPTIAEVKAAKINEMSMACKTAIESGVDVEINGETLHFSYDTEDQNNIKDAFDLAYQTGLDVPYHADGYGCKLYTPQQITMIFIMNKTNLTHHTTYFNQLRMQIEDMSNVDTVEAVQYGDPLTGQYLSNYTAMMEQAQLVISALLGLEEPDYELESGGD